MLFIIENPERLIEIIICANELLTYYTVKSETVIDICFFNRIILFFDYFKTWDESQGRF